ncbi:hypothetical protein OAP87_02210 [Flavobacteriaceae bacterium]|nr:hypothetical protein [Flavobacteriaceae bacterium]
MKKLLSTTVLLLSPLKVLHIPKIKLLSSVFDWSEWKGSLKEKDGKHYYIVFRNPEYQYIVDRKKIHIGSKSDYKELRQAILNTIGTKDKRTFEGKHHIIYVIPRGKKYVRIGRRQEYSSSVHTAYFSARQIKKLLPEILN